MSTTTTPQDVSQESPVTWHVIVWVLLSLAGCSMAQPAGRIGGLQNRRNIRMYLCISPLVCLADALSVLSSIVLTRCMFDVTLKTAVKFTVFRRYRHNANGQNSADNLELAIPHSWPRWIFFIIGTLPALIKLISFSGLPWSRTWGLIYGTSYVLIESVNFISGYASEEIASSTVVASGYATSELSQEAEDDVTRRATLLLTIFAGTSLFLISLALVLQNILIIYAIHDILRTASVLSDIHVPADTLRTVDIIIKCFLIMFLGFGVFKMLKSGFSKGKPDEFGVLCFILMEHIFIISFWPDREDPRRPTGNGTRTYIFVTVCGIIYVIYSILKSLCSKFPRLGKALLVMASTDVVDEQGQAVSHPDSHVDKFSVLCLTMFCLNLCVGITWYATAYDPTGTVNPAWTDIFG